MERTEQLEQRVIDIIQKTSGFFLLAKVTPQFSDVSPIAKIVFREANDYLDLLKEIIYNRRKDLVSVFGVNLLTHHTVLALCINYLTTDLGMEPPKELVSKYSIFDGFLGLLHRIEYEDILNDESGLWATLYKSERA